MDDILKKQVEIAQREAKIAVEAYSQSWGGPPEVEAMAKVRLEQARKKLESASLAMRNSSTSQDKAIGSNYAPTGGSTTIFKQAAQAIKQGDKSQARKLLQPILKKNSNNETALLLYSYVAETKKIAVFCLQKILEISPDNSNAKQRLLKFQSEKMPAPPPVTLQTVSEENKHHPSPSKVASKSKEVIASTPPVIVSHAPKQTHQPVQNPSEHNASAPVFPPQVSQQVSRFLEKISPLQQKAHQIVQQMPTDKSTGSVQTKSIAWGNVAWGKTVLLNFERIVIPSILWFLIALVTGATYEEALYELLYIPVHFFFVWPASWLLGWVIAIIFPWFLLFRKLIYYSIALPIALVADPVIWLLSKAMPFLVPVKKYPPFNFAMIVYVIE